MTISDEIKKEISKQQLNDDNYNKVRDYVDKTGCQEIFKQMMDSVLGSKHCSIPIIGYTDTCRFRNRFISSLSKVETDNKYDQTIYSKTYDEFTNMIKINVPNPTHINQRYIFELLINRKCFKSGTYIYNIDEKYPYSFSFEQSSDNYTHMKIKKTKNESNKTF